MKASSYIMSKQVQWARRKNISLIGSQGTKGFPAYTQILDENLFEPLAQEVRDDILKGDGGEIIGSINSPAKMNAVHSSSALGVNIFHYWKSVGKIDIIAHACGLCAKNNSTQTDIRFEQKFPISPAFQFAPNIDVVIENNQEAQYEVYAIECKFSEAYSNYEHPGIKPEYFNSNFDNLWQDIPGLNALASSICPIDNEYRHLHPAQLIKHILGLKNKYKKKDSFRLLYLWYDAFGEEGFVHRSEIEKFARIAKSDNIRFSSITYQELITFLADNHYLTNEKYVNYITDRYL
jgi:hypothetical protein